MHRRLVQVIEEGEEATITAEVHAHIQVIVDQLIRRM